MRIRLALLLPVLLLLPVALPASYAEPRPTWNLAARVPASCLAFVGLEDLDLMKQREEQTALGKLGRDPAMQPFVAPLLKALENMPLPPEFPEPVRELLKMAQSLRGQMALAFVGMDPAKGEPALVASVDFGTRTGEFGKLLERLAGELGKNDVKVTATTKDGRPLWTATIRGGPTLSATIVDTTFVVATTPGLLADVVGTPAASGTLAASPEFKGVVERVGREGLALLAYANVQAALAALGDAIPSEARKMFEVMGLDTWKAVAYGMSYAGDGYRDTILIHAPGADHGMISQFKLAPIERPRLLSLAPANAFAFAEANFSFEHYLDFLRSTFLAMEPSIAAEMDKGLAQIDAQLGVSIEKDLLGGLGGTVGWYGSMPQGGGLFPEVALMATVKDPAAYEAVIDRFVQGVTGMVNEDGTVIARPRTIDYEGQKLHLVELQMARGDDLVPFTPSWTLLGDRLVVTLVPYTLKEIVWRAKHADAAGPGLDAQEDFKALWAQKPASAGSVSYLDLQAILGILYDTGVPLLQALVKPNMIKEFAEKLPLDFALLPPARVVRPYLRSMMCFESWDANGIEVRMHGPIPLLPVIIGVSVAAGVVLPMAMGGRHADLRIRDMDIPMEEPVAVEDEQSRARGEIRQLTSFVNLYLLEEQALPSSLEDLVKKSFLESLPKDPWDHPYRLVVIDAKARTFQVVSNGPDGKPGTGDDVTTAPPR